MFDSIVTYLSSFSSFRILILFFSFIVVAIKVTNFLVRRKDSIDTAENQIVKEERFVVANLAINIAVVLILCFCLLIFLLVQNGYYGKNICQDHLLSYLDPIFSLTVLISWIIPDINDLWLKNPSVYIKSGIYLFQFIISILYFPIYLGLVVICR